MEVREEPVRTGQGKGAEAKGRKTHPDVDGIVEDE